MKRKIPIFALPTGVLILIAVFMLAQPQAPYVATVNGHRIGLEEYYVYLYEQKLLFESRGGYDIWDMDFDGESSEEVAKQNALSSIELVKVSIKQADTIGISLTAAEKNDSADYARVVYARMGILANKLEITEDMLTVIMEENDLYRKLFDEITADYVLDEDEFDEYFDNLYESNKEYVTSLDDFDLLREDIRQSYIDERKFEVYMVEYAQWIKNVTTTKNTPVWNKISIQDLDETQDGALPSSNNKIEAVR